MTAVRGCGTRVKGGVYLECPLSPDGLPLEHFLVDPPRVVEPALIGITPLGVKLVSQKRPCPNCREGLQQVGPDPRHVEPCVTCNGEGGWLVYHILDWVGSDSYPNVADFVEEVRRLGLSRRLSRTLDFSLLTAESQIVLVHARAFIENHAGFYAALSAELGTMATRCPKLLDDHGWDVSDHDDCLGCPAAPEEMCAGLWWEDVEHGEPPPAARRGDHDYGISAGRSVVRRMPSFQYDARRRPAGVKLEYLPAVFLRLPAKRLVVINDPEGGEHEQSLAAASRSSLPVALEEE